MSRSVIQKTKKGRPSKITNYKGKEMVISLMYQRGFTDEQIALALNITRRTLENWKKKDKGFFHTLKTSKKVADEKVEVALFERACGYSHPEIHITNYQGIITKTPILKHYPPDSTSMIFWLKNRKPKEWQDKKEVALNGEITVMDKIIVEGKDFKPEIGG